MHEMSYDGKNQGLSGIPRRCLMDDSDILDIEVHPQEMEDLMGQEWPSEGQQCPVESCKSRPHIFRQIGSYRQHYLRFHKKKVPHYYCPAIHFGFFSMKLNSLRKHISKKHRGLQGCIYRKYSCNEKFCAPGSVVMPVPPVNRKARDQAVEERRSRVTDELFQLPENYNARDSKPCFF
ncbi:uncharacterized protein LOC130051775 [Ostrea edulis]|uniref:uncharacterized protein LOC130051775 n=1 Tax=Ostrea edulis TaxID=37623 RepID=UPI0024AED0CB|nr:uncharacterized protein LOC130051775 [Ostrea edulis]